jgi:hypothetical protein
MPYDGRYGKVAKAMKRKRAHERFGIGRGVPDGEQFHKGGGTQKGPPNVGVPPYKHKDSTTGKPQDARAKAQRPRSMKMGASRNPAGSAMSARQGSPGGPRSPMPKYQDRGKHPVKRDATKKATGYRSFQSIIKGNVMGARLPPKKGKPKSMRPTPKR